ncbi:hypothetical protein MTO96_049527 [Rhipicephalus appendiculatus]
MGTPLEIAELSWWYLYVRIADFLDTFFFVARKKFSKISALHVTHHFLVGLSGWVWLNFGNEGQGLLGLIINQAVHVIMYTYYFLAALGPSVRPYLWWKKCLTSLQIAQSVAPRWMKNREPYKLRGAILTYNVATALVNAYFCYRYARVTYFGGGYSFFCQGINKDGHSTEEAELNWWYLYVRIADFLDTFFFVARKKFSQVSALHVIHHFLVVLSGWVWLNFGNEGQALLLVIINQAVHVIMYTYYFLAALGPSVRPYLWWKKYLTSLQIAQFMFIVVHISIPIFYDCGYPKPLAVFGVAQLLLGLALFINFYVQTYMQKRGGQ